MRGRIGRRWWWLGGDAVHICVVRDAHIKLVLYMEARSYGCRRARASQWLDIILEPRARGVPLAGGVYSII